MIQKAMNEIYCKTLNIKDTNEYDDNNDIKLYKIELNKFQEITNTLTSYLTPPEHNRANRYHFIKDKNRFIICRTILKFILAEQTGLEVDKITIAKDHNKKPYLSSNPSLFFNVTHAANYAIIATANSSIGVDIEYINKDFDYKEILPSIFNDHEINEIVSNDDKHHTFYQLWTRKEAIVKATGKGIDDNIKNIVSLDGHHYVPKGLLSNIKTMKVFSFELNESYIGAIAFSDITKDINELLFYPIPLKFQKLLISK